MNSFDSYAKNGADHRSSALLGQNTNAPSQFSTFYISNRWYGIDVIRVQEVVRPMPITPIPLAPPYVAGLINLRGQIVTAINIRNLFGLSDAPPDQFMNVVCKYESTMVSFQVDEIGDVIEVTVADFESLPQTIPNEIKRFLFGIYKVPGSLLSAIDIDKINRFLNHNI